MCAHPQCVLSASFSPRPPDTAAPARPRLPILALDLCTVGASVTAPLQDSKEGLGLGRRVRGTATLSALGEAAWSVSGAGPEGPQRPLHIHAWLAQEQGPNRAERPLGSPAAPAVEPHHHRGLEAPAGHAEGTRSTQSRGRWIWFSVSPL